MAARLTDDQRQEILDLLADDAGHSCNEIASRTGRSPDTISRIARSIGHRFGRTNLARARDAQSAYCAEHRALTAAKAQQRADEMLAKMEGRYLVFNFGGKDNTYEEHELDEPPVEALRAMAQTFRELQRTVLDIDKHDNRADDNLSAVEAWLAHVAPKAEVSE